MTHFLVRISVHFLIQVAIKTPKVSRSCGSHFVSKNSLTGWGKVDTGPKMWTNIPWKHINPSLVVFQCVPQFFVKFNPKTPKTLHRNHLPLNAGEACFLGENPQKIAIPTYLEAKKVRNRFSSLSWIDPRNSGLKWSIFDEVMLPKFLRNFFGPFFFWLWFENFVATWWKNRWQNEVKNCVTMLFSLNPN